MKLMIRKRGMNCPLSFQGSTDSDFWVFQGLTTLTFRFNFIEIFCMKLMIPKRVTNCLLSFQGSTYSDFWVFQGLTTLTFKANFIEFLKTEILYFPALGHRPVSENKYFGFSVGIRGHV